MLLPDGGPRLRDLAPGERGDHDLDAWVRLLPRYAELQRSVEGRADALVAAGVPDERPERLTGVLDGLVAADPIWARLDADEVEGGIRARGVLSRRRADIAALAAGLAGSGIRPTIEHGDLHGGNILVGEDGVRFFDWGDATVAHPFGTLTTTLTRSPITRGWIDTARSWRACATPTPRPGPTCCRARRSRRSRAWRWTLGTIGKSSRLGASLARSRAVRDRRIRRGLGRLAHRLREATGAPALGLNASRPARRLTR